MVATRLCSQVVAIVSFLYLPLLIQFSVFSPLKNGQTRTPVDPYHLQVNETNSQRFHVEQQVTNTSNRMQHVPTTINLNHTWPNPVLVVGMPKAGTSTVAEYFRCGGVRRISHWTGCQGKISRGYCAHIIHSNVVEKQVDPLFDSGDNNVYAQLDYPGKDFCYFPQVEVLEEIHKFHPTSTLILNQRNMKSWIRSVKKWHGLASRINRCNITGLPPGVGGKDHELAMFYEDQVKRVRDLVKRYPSHRLVEVFVDSPDAGEVMERAFGIDRNCWGHRNANPKLSKNKDSR